MAGQIKKFTLQMIAGANIATIILMLLVGNVDKLNPADHPLLSNLGLVFPLFLFINFCFLVFFAFFKRKYMLFPLLGFIVGYPAVRKYWPLNIKRDVPAGSIKVLTYNVCNFSRDVSPDGEPNPILEYIVGSDADIVCLQEARLDAEVMATVKDTYKYIDTVCNMPAGSCVMLLSKWRILSKTRIAYPSKSNLSAAFKVLIDKDTVTIVNNHLETSGLSAADRSGFREMVKGHTGKDSMRVESKRLLVKLGESARLRAPQAEAVARCIKDSGGSIILCGDFNDNPLSYTHRVIGQGLTDCYIEAGNGPGITYHHNAIFVRIDNIMCSSDWEPYNCKVDRSIAFSDHYPMFCWLKRQEKRQGD